MRKYITVAVAFILFNLLFLRLHLWVFNGSEPFLCILSVLIHLSTLIFMPYEKFFRRNAGLFLLLITSAILFPSCTRVEPNYEGVLMEDYGRSGKEDFKSVTGSQNTMAPGTELYQVPMYEQKADPQQVGITARDGGYFGVDPAYTYQPIRGKGVDIIFNYKHVGVSDKETMMDNIEANVLNALVLNAYREEARKFTTDSLLNNLNSFETKVEERLKTEFEAKHFTVNSLTSGLKPPQSMVEAIERRNNAIQQAEQVKNELQVSRMQLEKAKINAERDKIQSTGLTKEVLTQQWIEAIRNSSNKVIITDGKTPIIIGQ